MQTRDWRGRNAWIADLLKRRTGDDVDSWNVRIRVADLPNETGPRARLPERGVTGHPQSMLVMERFGYPWFLVASADELVDGQYRDRPALQPMLDAILSRVASLGQVTIQTRKMFVSLVTPGERLRRSSLPRSGASISGSASTINCPSVVWRLSATWQVGW